MLDPSTGIYREWAVAENANINVTTFVSTAIFKLKKQFVLWDWLIWFADSDVSDVIDIERHDPKKWS